MLSPDTSMRVEAPRFGTRFGSVLLAAGKLVPLVLTESTKWVGAGLGGVGGMGMATGRKVSPHPDHNPISATTAAICPECLKRILRSVQPAMKLSRFCKEPLF